MTKEDPKNQDSAKKKPDGPPESTPSAEATPDLTAPPENEPPIENPPAAPPVEGPSADPPAYLFKPRTPGEFMIGIPARDLTEAEFDALDPWAQRNATADGPDGTPLYHAVETK